VYPSLTAMSGAEQLLVCLAEGLTARGHEVRIVTRNLDRSLFNPAGCEVVELGESDSLLDWAAFQRAGRALEAHVHQFDIINPHIYPANYWCYFSGADRSRIVWTCHEPLRYLYRSVLDDEYRRLMRRRMSGAGDVGSRLSGAWPLARPIYRRLRFGGLDRRTKRLDHEVARSARSVIAISDFGATQIRAALGVESVVCHAGSPDAQQPARRPRSDRIRFLSVARLWPEKNLDTVLLGFARLDPRVKTQVNLTVVGRGPDERYLRRLTSALGLSEQVDFLAEVDDDRLRNLYQESDALISVPLGEPFGLVFTEAASRGLPSIGPNHGGPAEIIQDGVSGLLVDALDPDALAAAVTRLTTEPELLATMGANARRRFEERFTVDHMVDRYLSVFERVRAA